MYKLRCAVQNYHWGNKGSESAVATLKKADDPEFEIKEQEHYAEYWFGTHASGPSEVCIDGKYQTLKSFIETHPETLGDSMGVTNLDLPFLSKILSVETALSIQAHPDKKLAEILHEKKPSLYKDDNHKPEMAYALGDFVAMCGFRDISSIVTNLHDCIYLRRVISEEVCVAFENAYATGGDMKEALRSLFTAFVEADPKSSLIQIVEMKNYLEVKSEKTFVEQWVSNLISQYPEDAGVFTPFLFNLITMHQGDAIYLGADIPHAYLSGHIVETMACSNNVVRAGLTPKEIDKETLIEMLTYEYGPVTMYHAEAKTEQYSTIETPAKEFMIEVMNVKKGDRMPIPVISVPRVLICYKGYGSIEGDSSLLFHQGSILFQVANDDEDMIAEEDTIIFATHERI